MPDCNCCPYEAATAVKCLKERVARFIIFISEERWDLCTLQSESHFLYGRLLAKPDLQFADCTDQYIIIRSKKG